MGLRYLDKTVELCQAKDIKLYIVISPALYDMRDFASYLSAYCRDKQVAFLDYSRDTLYTDNPLWWKDGSHMNCRGADRFTREMIRLMSNN